MQSIQEQLIQEINRTPDQLLQEVLDFLQLLNQKHKKIGIDEGEKWPPGFFDEVIGGWEGEKLIRKPQPDYPIR
jgi:hypothetical protein